MWIEFKLKLLQACQEDCGFCAEFLLGNELGAFSNLGKRVLWTPEGSDIIVKPSMMRILAGMLQLKYLVQPLMYLTGSCIVCISDLRFQIKFQLSKNIQCSRNCSTFVCSVCMLEVLFQGLHLIFPNVQCLHHLRTRTVNTVLESTPNKAMVCTIMIMTASLQICHQGTCEPS